MDANRRRVASSVTSWAAALAIALRVQPALGQDAAPSVCYVSPSPAARLILPQTSLVVRFDRVVDAARLDLARLMTVIGARSGAHVCTARLSDDARTVVIKPTDAFLWGERVTVTVAAGVRAGVLGPDHAFSFSIAPRAAARPVWTWEAESPPGGHAPAIARPAPAISDVDAASDTVPSDFPAIQTRIYGTPSPGRLFLAGLSTNGSITPYLMIIDDQGNPAFAGRPRGNSFDFKLQPTGALTYYDVGAGRFLVMNSAYVTIDSIQGGNGYGTDLHELRLLPNGHALLMSYDYEPVDMSAIVPGGDSTAIVVGLVIQELDEARDVVFQWRSWDHFQITDATHVDLTGHQIDYVHGNALEVDYDGNLLLSSRHMDEITKINRVTGEIVWRWGGKNNEFAWVADSLQGFSYQHAIRRLSNGHYTLWDNGDYHDPPESRALEYALDEPNRIAKLVWEYRGDPPLYSFAMGYVERLPTGNTLIAQGFGKPDIIEVDPAGNKVMDVTLPANYFTYRAFRDTWETGSWPVSADLDSESPMRSFPNPARGLSTLAFRLVRRGPVSLSLYDVRGRRIREVLRGELRGPGDQQVALPLSDLPAGLYFARVSFEGRTRSRRIAVLR